jgi:hypothetical protein
MVKSNSIRIFHTLIPHHTLQRSLSSLGPITCMADALKVRPSCVRTCIEGVVELELDRDGQSRREKVSFPTSPRGDSARVL